MKIKQLKTPCVLYMILLCFIFTWSNAQNTLTLQPGPLNGFDTPIGFYPPLNYSTQNFSSMGELLAKALIVNGSCSIARSLLRFDLSVIPTDATILSASLTLFGIEGVNPPHVGANSSYLRMVTSSWNASTVTWNSEPSTTQIGQVTLAQSVSQYQNYTLDVTNMVSLMIANPTSNFGFELGLFNETCGSVLTFGSSKNTNPSKRPMLIVKYWTTTKIQENSLYAPLRIYPNPSEGKVEMQSGNDCLRLELHDLVSGLVFAKDLQGTGEQIDLSHLPAGAYICKAFSASGQTRSGMLIFK